MALSYALRLLLWEGHGEDALSSVVIISTTIVLTAMHSTNAVFVQPRGHCHR